LTACSSREAGNDSNVTATADGNNVGGNAASLVNGAGNRSNSL